MPENVIDTPKKPSIASFGATQIVENKVNGNAKTDIPATGGNDDDKNKGANATSGANNGGAAHDSNTKATPPAPTFTDEELTAFFKDKGIDYEGIDKLKEKLTTPAKTSTEPTEEQKKQKEQAREKRLLDKFMSDGQSAEAYVAIKGVASADPHQYAINVAKAKLIKIGYTAAEADVYVKENLFQIDDAELEKNEDETEKAYQKRVKEFNADLLAANSNPHIEKAKWVLQNLNEAIEAEDLQAQNELTISANIDEQFKTLSRKDTYEIGEINKVKIPPVESEVPETEWLEVRDMLKDPDKRNNLFINKDGGLNITEIGRVYAENVKLKAAVKAAFHESATRTNAFWENKFGKRSPQEIGVGGSDIDNSPKKGKISSIGKTTMI